MATEPERLEELYQAREGNRVRPHTELVHGIEAQIDEDLKGGWGDIEETYVDDQDPRCVLVSFTVELDPILVTQLDDLDDDERAVVERELQRRYLAAGFRSLALLDEGRVRIGHLVEPGEAPDDQEAPPPEDEDGNENEPEDDDPDEVTSPGAIVE